MWPNASSSSSFPLPLTTNTRFRESPHRSSRASRTWLPGSRVCTLKKRPTRQCKHPSMVKDDEDAKLYTWKKFKIQAAFLVGAVILGFSHVTRLLYSPEPTDLHEINHSVFPLRYVQKLRLHECRLTFSGLLNTSSPFRNLTSRMAKMDICQYHE